MHARSLWLRAHCGCALASAARSLPQLESDSDMLDMQNANGRRDSIRFSQFKGIWT
jgi:hypothetical protein